MSLCGAGTTSTPEVSKGELPKLIAKSSLMVLTATRFIEIVVRKNYKMMVDSPSLFEGQWYVILNRTLYKLY